MMYVCTCTYTYNSNKCITNTYIISGDMYSRGANGGGAGLSSANIGIMPPSTGPASNANKPNTEYCAGYGPYGKFVFLNEITAAIY